MIDADACVARTIRLNTNFPNKTCFCPEASFCPAPLNPLVESDKDSWCQNRPG